MGITDALGANELVGIPPVYPPVAIMDALGANELVEAEANPDGEGGPNANPPKEV